MSILSLDLGGTKLAIALFSEQGEIKTKHTVALNGRSGNLVGELIVREVGEFIQTKVIDAVGVAVPGIYSVSQGTVWAPNIPGWENYPLLAEVSAALHNVPITIESDRACYISGEIWKGNAQACTDAIFMAVGTGIGAGIISGGNILRGASDIAGAIGWLALNLPYQKKYDQCGCFEYHASGEGLRKVYIEKANATLSAVEQHRLTAYDIFERYEMEEPTAKEVLKEAISYWGMAAANLVSIFNPEKIIFGGGVFGPAKKLIGQIREEAMKWAQPVSMQQTEFCTSALGNDAGLFGAAYLALQKLASKKSNDAF